MKLQLHSPMFRALTDKTSFYAPPSLAVVLLPERRSVALLLALLPHAPAGLGPPPPLRPLGRLLVSVALVVLPEGRVLALGLALLPNTTASLTPEPPHVAVLLSAAAAAAADDDASS